jgi:hypothetical protein
VALPADAAKRCLLIQLIALRRGISLRDDLLSNFLLTADIFQPTRLVFRSATAPV